MKRLLALPIPGGKCVEYSINCIPGSNFGCGHGSEPFTIARRECDQKIVYREKCYAPKRAKKRIKQYHAARFPQEITT